MASCSITCTRPSPCHQHLDQYRRHADRANLAPPTCSGHRRHLILCHCLGKRHLPTEMDEKNAAHFYSRCNEIDVAEVSGAGLAGFDLPGCARPSPARWARAPPQQARCAAAAELKLCTHYLIDDKQYSVMPDNPYLHQRAQPVYIVLSWLERAAGGDPPLPRPPRQRPALRGRSRRSPCQSHHLHRRGPRNQDIIRR